MHTNILYVYRRNILCFANLFIIPIYAQSLHMLQYNAEYILWIFNNKTYQLKSPKIILKVLQTDIILVVSPLNYKKN